MTTDLNKILARQDYVKLTKSLRENCDYVESAISTKMEELELNGKNGGIEVNGMKVFCIKSCLFVRTPEKDDGYGYQIEYRAVRSFVCSGDEVFDEESHRNFLFSPCSNKHALNFLNNAVAIIEKLGEIEQEKVDAINKAIEATKDL